MTAIDQNSEFARLSPATIASAAAVPSAGLLITYFLVTILPISKEVAGLLLSPLRIMLLILFIPYMFKIYSGKLGGNTIVDKLMMAHAFWIFVALIAVHGTSRIAFAGITMVELVGGYFLGRVLVRDAASYKYMVKLIIFVMIFLLPFALIELKTGRLVIPEILDKAFDTIHRGYSAYGRWGLERVYAVFEHPILFGLFCSVALANIFYMVKSKVFLRLVGVVFAFGMTFMSLSSAPLLSCGMQFILIAWDKISKSRWGLFMILAVGFYVLIDSLSNRTPITILIETMTFNSGTGWTRIAIFNSGIAAVQGSPFVGIGFNDWPRPHWLTSSVDNFWLLTAMRYGFVGAGFLVFAFVMHFYRIMRTPVVNEEIHRLRTGYGIALAAICFTLVTVHVWGSIGVFVMFYLGAGAWFYTTDEAVATEDGEGEEDRPAPQTGTRFTRSAHKHKRGVETAPPKAPKKTPMTHHARRMELIEKGREKIQRISLEDR